jgi:tetratricopeptide (TPR) repeat protein
LLLGRLCLPQLGGALTHVLVLGESEHQRAFQQYLDELRRGHGGRELFQRYFPAARLAALDAAYTALFQSPTMPSSEIAFTPVARQYFDPEADAVAASAATVRTEYAVRSMPSAETHVLWGALQARAEYTELAEREARAAIAADPSFPGGYLLSAALDWKQDRRSQAIERVRRARALRPTDAAMLRTLAWLLLLSNGTKGETDALAAELEKASVHSEDFEFLAHWDLKRGRFERAVERGERGVALDSSCSDCLLSAARAASKLGDLERAVRHAQRAVAILAERSPPTLEQALHRYEAQLAQQRGAPSTPPEATPSAAPGK